LTAHYVSFIPTGFRTYRCEHLINILIVHYQSGVHGAQLLAKIRVQFSAKSLSPLKPSLINLYFILVKGFFYHIYIDVYVHIIS
jgi:hypothetical protein